jgi:hypothetical protein
VLVVAWLLGALRAGGPYPVLAIAGEQGSAKTVLSKLLRAVIDPSVAPVRALPRDERELFIAASNGHVLAFDNLSGLPPWLSDTSRQHRRCSCPPSPRGRLRYADRLPTSSSARFGAASPTQMCERIRTSSELELARPFRFSVAMPCRRGHRIWLEETAGAHPENP